MLKKHKKLIEAIGLLFVLGAWVLQWSFAEKLNKATEGFKQLIESTHNIHLQVRRDIAITLEAAITRAVSGDESSPEEVYTKYVYAWRSPEVRKLWLQALMNETQQITSIIEAIWNTEQEFNLKSNPYCRSLEKDKIELFKQLSDDLEKIPTDGLMPIPDPNKITSIKATEYSSQLNNIFGRTEKPINYTMNELAQLKKRNSAIFRIVFVFGSFLLIFAKLLDWFYDFKKSIKLEGKES